MGFTTQLEDGQLFFGAGSGSINADDIPETAARVWLTPGTQIITGVKVFQSNIQISGSASLTDDLMTSGNIYINYGGPDGASFLYFYENGSPAGEYLAWMDADHTFYMSSDLTINGNLSITGNLTMGWPIIPITATIKNVTDPTDPQDVATMHYVGHISGSCAQNLQSVTNIGNVTNNEIIAGTLSSNGNIYVNKNGPDGDQYLYFYQGASPTGAYFEFIDATPGFKLSHTLDMNSTKITSVADPAANQDVSTKKYVDDKVGALTLSNVCDVGATTTKQIGCKEVALNYAQAAGDVKLIFYKVDGSAVIFKFSQLVDAFQLSKGLYITGTIEAASMNIAGLAQCDSFRIDQDPTVGTFTPDKYITISCNGTNYKIPVKAV